MLALTPGQGRVGQVSPLLLFLSPLAMCPFWKEVSLHSLHLRGGELSISARGTLKKFY